MSTAARSTATTAARHFVEPNAAALAIEVARLERELRGAQSRNRALLRALSDRVCARPAIATVRDPDARVAAVLLAGRTAESMGAVPIVRFTRDVVGTIVGLEIALLPEDPGAPAITAIVPGELAGMAVTGAD